MSAVLEMELHGFVLVIGSLELIWGNVRPVCIMLHAA